MLATLIDIIGCCTKKENQNLTTKVQSVAAAGKPYPK